jgi:uncharacterized membrane protein YhiD involved in acid resistance
VWVAAALGIACGLAMWRTAIPAIVLALVLLVVAAWFTQMLPKKDDSGT